MGDTERWVIQQNLDRFLNRLECDDSARNCASISKLLIAETDKLAQYAAKLDDLEDHIARCDGLIARLHMRLDGGDAAARNEFAEALGNLSQIKDVLLAVRKRAKTQ